jgi:putative FmdB family regulatory protein
VPIYGYKCDNCGNVFDMRQTFEDEPRYECPQCQHIARRTFHAPPVIYKGSGFYTTDYARKDKSSTKAPSANTSSSDSSSESSSSSSSDSSSSTSSSDSSSSSAKSDSSSSSSSSDSGSSSSSSSSTPAKSSD